MVTPAAHPADADVDTGAHLSPDGGEGGPVLRVTGLTFSYPRWFARANPRRTAGAARNTRPTIDDISFDVAAGQLLFLLGPNGCGKSTLFRLLLGLLRPDAGRIVIAGHDASALSVRRLARLVSYVPQAEASAFDFTAREVALMGRTPHLSSVGQRVTARDEAAVDRALATLRIDHLADVGVRSLSGGERQLVLIARALAQEARVLVLDEPTSALDFAHQTRVLGVLRGLAAGGLTLLVSSHNPMHALTHADRVLLLSAGQVAKDTAPGDLDEGDLSRLYDTPLRLLRTQEAPGLRLCVPAELSSGVPIGSSGVPIGSSGPVHPRKVRRP